MRTRTLVGWLVPLAMAVLVGAGCHPGEIDDITEADIVITTYDQSVDFGTYFSYAMEDTIYNLLVLQDPTEDDDLDRRFDAEIIAQVKSEMAARGYALVDTSAAHDLRIGLGAFDVEGSLIYSYSWWGYGWYPAWGSVDFTKGSLVVLMADWANRDEESDEIEPIWTGGVDGILEDSASNMQARIEQGISQMFIQSPYLRSNVTKVDSGEVR